MAASQEQLHLRAGKARMHGHLFKRGKINTGWKKRWFLLTHGRKLFYFKTPNDAKPLACVPVQDVSIRPTKDKRFEGFIFDLITSNRVYHLAAQSAADMQQWVQALSEATQLTGENALLAAAEGALTDVTLDKARRREQQFLQEMWAHQLRNTQEDDLLLPGLSPRDNDTGGPIMAGARTSPHPQPTAPTPVSDEPRTIRIGERGDRIGERGSWIDRGWIADSSDSVNRRASPPPGSVLTCLPAVAPRATTTKRGLKSFVNDLSS